MFAGRPRFIALAFICLSRGSFNIQLAMLFGIALTLAVCRPPLNQFNHISSRSTCLCLAARAGPIFDRSRGSSSVREAIGRDEIEIGTGRPEKTGIGSDRSLRQDYYCDSPPFRMGTKPQSLGSHAHRAPISVRLQPSTLRQGSRIFKAPRKREFRRSRSGAHGRAPATGGSGRLSGALKRALRSLRTPRYLLAIPARFSSSAMRFVHLVRFPRSRLMNLMVNGNADSGMSSTR